jgi:hypothetical protein
MTTTAPRTDAELLGDLEHAFATLREAEAHVVELSAEVSRRSAGPDGLASRRGCTGAPALVAEIGLVPQATAARYCRVGDVTTPRLSLVGEILPSLYPAVGDALALRQIGLDSASHITAALAGASPRALPEHLEAAELALVHFARDNPADAVRRLAAKWRDALDPDGLEPHELVEKRFLRRTLLANGMKQYLMQLDPVSAAYLDAAIDASVSSAMRVPRFDEVDATAPRSQEPTIPIAQLAADALVDLARHGLACDNTLVPLPSATIVVRMTLESLQTGTGLAEIDGSESTIPASVARRMAADADLIPVVLGGASEVLDWGRAKRLFTRAQKLALVERDGGCAWANCDRPPSYTEAHHIRWWQAHSGRTDMSNGVLLCSRHHHIVHRDEWEIEIVDNVPWFRPPPTVDIHRRSRRGGRFPATDFTSLDEHKAIAVG